MWPGYVASYTPPHAGPTLVISPLAAGPPLSEAPGWLDVGPLTAGLLAVLSGLRGVGLERGLFILGDLLRPRGGGDPGRVSLLVSLSRLRLRFGEEL